MLLVVAFELIKPVAAVRTRTDMVLCAITLIFSLLINMAAGFLVGFGWHCARVRFVKLNLEKNQ
jgi:hypothetical protein